MLLGRSSIHLGGRVRANLMPGGRQPADRGVPGSSPERGGVRSGMTCDAAWTGANSMAVSYHDPYDRTPTATPAGLTVNYGTGDRCQSLGPAIADLRRPAESSPRGPRPWRVRCRRCATENEGQPGTSSEAARRARPLRRRPAPAAVQLAPREQARNPAARGRLGIRARRGRAARGRVQR